MFTLKDSTIYYNNQAIAFVEGKPRDSKGKRSKHWSDLDRLRLVSSPQGDLAIKAFYAGVNSDKDTPLLNVVDKMNAFLRENDPNADSHELERG